MTTTAQRTVPVPPQARSPRRLEVPEEQRPRLVRAALVLDPGWTSRRLAVIAANLVLLHVWIQLVHYLVLDIDWSIRRLIHLDAEQSLGTWYSAFLLLGASLASAACARAHRDDRTRLPWGFLAAGFLLLSVDEVAGFHEAFNSKTEFSWAIPGSVLVLLVGAGLFRFLRQLPRDVARWMILAGTVYVGGALGMELAAEPMARNGRIDTLGYNLWVALEEGMEMAGVLIFLFATQVHLARTQTRERYGTRFVLTARQDEPTLSGRVGGR